MPQWQARNHECSAASVFVSPKGEWNTLSEWAASVQRHLHLTSSSWGRWETRSVFQADAARVFYTASFQGFRIRRGSIVEFKTSVSDFDESEVEPHDQLTAYKLIEPDVEQIAICVFIKFGTPRIEWHLTARSVAQVLEFVEKTKAVASQITGVFYKRPGNWCCRCDFLPECLGDREKSRDTLIKIAPLHGYCLRSRAPRSRLQQDG